MHKVGLAKLKQPPQITLEKTYQANKISCQRKMFCTMINQFLSTQSQFDLMQETIYEHSLLDIFEDKIISFFQFYKFKPEYPQAIVKIYTYDSMLFNQYFKQSKNPKMQYLTKSIKFNPNFKMLYGYLHPSVDLIQLIFNGKEVEMMLDLNELFAKTVHSRTKKEINKNLQNTTHLKPQNSLLKEKNECRHIS